MADVINLLMNENGFIRYNQLSHSEIAVIVPLTFIGFIVTNGILSSFQSHVTRPVLQHQIHSIEDIYHSPFPVVVFTEGLRDTMISYFSNRTEYKDWDDKIIVNLTLYSTNFELYEGTMAFFDVIYATNVILKVQNLLNIKGFHDTKIQIKSVPLSYPISDKFLFCERLSEIIQWIEAAGLYDKWAEGDWYSEEQRILAKNIDRLKNLADTADADLEFFVVIVFGWIVGFVVFVCEVLWKKIEGNEFSWKWFSISRIKSEVQTNYD